MKKDECCVLYSLFITESPKLLRRTDNTVKVLLGEVVHRIIRTARREVIFRSPRERVGSKQCAHAQDLVYMYNVKYITFLPF